MRALGAAQWIPSLRLHAIVERDSAPGRSAVETIIYGELLWPLGRAPANNVIAGAREGRRRSQGCSALVDRIAAAWHKRQLAEEAANDVAAELKRQEADAEIEALVGPRDAEERP